MLWLVTPALSAGRNAVDVHHLAGARLSEVDLHLVEKRPVELHPVLGNMNNEDSKSQVLEGVFEFKSPVNRDQSIEPVLEERDKLMILNLVPSEIDCCRDLVTGEGLRDARIDAGV
jgi:hypothetical protein